MNPVIVLAILVIGHHLFGVWGLILGVPVANYVHFHVVKGQDPMAPAESAPAGET